MRRAHLFATVLLLAGSPALASISDAPSTAQKTTMPQSIWQVGEDGSALHLQSQWLCPVAYDDFRRDDLHAYDAYGFDVDCDYRHLNKGGDVTLYLTRSTGG